MQGFSRSFHSFSEAAAEAGISRIFGGIHFMSANQQGLASGARLGTYVSENFLKPRTPNAVGERPKPTEISTEPATRRIVATGGQETSKGEAP